MEADDALVIPPGLLPDVMPLDRQPLVEKGAVRQHVRVAGFQFDREGAGLRTGMLGQPGAGFLLGGKGADETTDFVVVVSSERECGDPAVSALLQAALAVSSFGHGVPLSVRC